MAYRDAKRAPSAHEAEASQPNGFDCPGRGESLWGERRQPFFVLSPQPPRRDLLDIALRLLAGLAMLFLVALLAVLLTVVGGLTGGGSPLGGALGDVGRVAARAGADAERLTRGVVDNLDPAHPPRGALSQDAEFDELRIVPPGHALGTTREYVLSVAEIRKREGTTSFAEAQCVVVHRQLQTPRETRILGQVVHVDRGEADYYLYKGESFRLGCAYYKVNWVSVERQEVAIARYRGVDDLVVTSKFQLD